MSRYFLGLPAPAKLNLFLHITGQRADGYHLLQSVFVPISLADTLDFEWRSDGRIERTGDLIGPLQGDLALRAARLLQAESATPQGAVIRVEKNIPAGAGMGGGSSDAATTLIALNRLWRLHWPRARLSALGLQLGADVPFFLNPGPAWVEGVGERITPLAVTPDGQPEWVVVVHPGVAVSTASVFQHPCLTRDTKPVTIRALSEVLRTAQGGLFGGNDCQAVVVQQQAAVGATLQSLDAAVGVPGAARMTGSGAAVFAVVGSEAAAKEGVARLRLAQPEVQCWAARILYEHPLSEWVFD